MNVTTGGNVTCTFINRRKPELRVVKHLNPNSNLGKFILFIDDTSSAPLGDNGSLDFLTVSFGPHFVGETGATVALITTFLGDYATTLSCGGVQKSTTGPVASDNTLTWSVDLTRVAPGSQVTCILTNKDSYKFMTGGGSVFTTADPPVRVTHGFQLHCDPRIKPNNLEVNWNDPNGASHKFKLQTLTSATCSDTVLVPTPPYADWDTYVGKGTGSFDGGLSNAYTAEWTFTDAGEPGNLDTATIKIYLTTTPLSPVLTVSGALGFGNQQAHQAGK